MRRWLAAMVLLVAGNGVIQGAESQSGRQQPAGEMSAFGGDVTAGNHYAAGVGVAIEVRPYIAGVFEFTYAGAGLDAVTSGYVFRNLASGGASRTLIPEFAAHLQFTSQRASVVPFVSAGVGLVNSRVRLITTRFGQTSSSTDHAEQTVAAIGGGLRWYVTRAFGIRPEINVYTTSRPFARFGAGIFYRWE